MRRVPRGEAGVAGWRRSVWWAIALAPIALTFAVYWPYADLYFANDDWSFLRGIKDGNLVEATLRGFTFPPFTEFTGPTPFFRPLPDVAYKLWYGLWGLRPEPYHLTNFVAHGVTGAALGALVARVARSPLTGLATAFLFTTWPSYESTVVWISQLGELSCAAFGLIALVAFHTYLTCERCVAHRWLAISAASMMLAALSKQTATIIFAVFPLLAWAESERRRNTRELLQAAAAIGCVLAIALGLWVYEQIYEAGVENVTVIRLSRLTRYEAYLRHVIWPFEGSPRSQRVLEVMYLGLGAYYVGIQKRPHAMFFTWSLIAVFPYAFTVGPEQPRYTYQAAMPFWAVMALTWRDALAWLSARAHAGAAGVAAGGSAILLAGIALVSAREARHAQVYIEAQAKSSSQLVTAIRQECGAMPEGSTVYAIGSTILDPFGTNNRSLVNVLFDKVYYRPLRERQTVEPPDCLVDLRTRPKP